MFIFSHFLASVTTAHKPFTPKHNNKNIRVQVALSQDRATIHTDAYASAYALGHAVATSKIHQTKKISPKYIIVIYLHL